MKQSITTPIFNEDQVYSILKAHPGLSLGDISTHLKAGISTTRKLTFSLLKSGRIIRVDKGKPKKPVYEYFTAEFMR